MTDASAEWPCAWWPRLPTRARRLVERLPAGYERIVRATGWHMAGHLAHLGAGLLVGIYVARYLGPASYGTLNYAVSFALLFSGLAQLGLAEIAVRELVAHPERQGETLGSALALRLASGTLTLGLAAAAAWATQADATTRLMIVAIAGGVFFQALSAPAEWFKSQVLARPVVVAGLIGIGTASALRVAFVMLGKPVVWFAWPFMFEAALTAAIVLAFYRRCNSPPLTSWRPRIQRMRELLALSWPLALTGGLVVIQQRIDQIMLGAILESSEVGWYAAAVRLSHLWNFVPFALATAVFPAIVRARATSQELFDLRMQAFFNLMLWLAVAIALPATLLAGPLVRFLFGEAYAPSASILQIHIWSLVFASIGTAAGRWMIAEGLTRVALVSSIISVLVNIGLNLLLIPSYGALGAAWATLAASGLAWLPLLIYQPTRPTGWMALKALSAPIRPLMRTS